MKLYGQELEALRSLPAGSDHRASFSLKVIRLLAQLVGLAVDYGTIREFSEVFLKKLSFSCGSNLMSDFAGVRKCTADAHAGGFAPL